MPPEARLPDFFVIGAQKCGTTDLSSHIGSHPDVWFSRPKEPYFFCRDDVEVLPYPFFERHEHWLDFDWDAANARLLRRYSQHFTGAAPGQLCGEGTPFYLPSRLAARRIRQTLPEAKFVVILRNPVDRAHSAYWHHMKMRRTTETFENHIRYEAGGTLTFGHCETQLRDWFDLFGRERFHILLFESYVRDRMAHTSEVFDFLGLPTVERVEVLRERQNTAKVPGSPLVQRLLNKAERLYPAHGATIEYDENPPRPLWELAASRTLRGLGRANLALRDRYEEMRPETRARLDAYYQRRNAGLAELIGRSLAQWGWT